MKSLAEKKFDNQRSEIKNAKSVNSMIEIISNEALLLNRGSFKKILRKTVNKKFKGDIEKTREYFISQLNEMENNFFSI